MGLCVNHTIILYIVSQQLELQFADIYLLFFANCDCLLIRPRSYIHIAYI